MYNVYKVIHKIRYLLNTVEKFFINFIHNDIKFSIIVSGVRNYFEQTLKISYDGNVE